MNPIVRIREGKGPFWGTLKTVARKMYQFHVPVFFMNKWMFKILYNIHVGSYELITWIIRFAWYEPLFRGQCESVGKGLCMEQLPYITGSGRIVIGSGVRLSGKSSIGFSNRLAHRPELVLGDGTFIGHGCSFSIGRSIKIGRNCLLAGGVRLADLDGHPTDAIERRSGLPSTPENIRRIEIGDDVWIGARASVLKGVKIGDRSIVGSDAVVTKDVPPDVVVAGNPARVVKNLTVNGDG